MSTRHLERNTMTTHYIEDYEELTGLTKETTVETKVVSAPEVVQPSPTVVAETA
jgi:hypothetical protein